jgi:penicillin-binding protein 2
VAGPINVTQAITQSIDTFFYNLGFQFYVHSKQYGPDPIQKVARAYGLGVKPTTPLPGAVAGRVDGPGVRKKLHAEAPKAFPYTSWTPGDAVEMAFGQGGTIITPLELATAYATFANGGTRYQPQPAANVLSPEGKVVKTFQPVVTGHVQVAPANRAAMLKGFIGAVQDPQGTAGATFAGFPFNQLQVAGKTGTSSNLTGKPDSLFVAFAGKNINHPQYVVAVVIPHSGFGASFAAPVARQILQYLAVHPAGPVAAPKPVSVLAPPPGPRASHRATTGSTLFPLPTLPGRPGTGPQGAGHTTSTLFPLPTVAGRPTALGPAGRSPP